MARPLNGDLGSKLTRPKVGNLACSVGPHKRCFRHQCFQTRSRLIGVNPVSFDDSEDLSQSEVFVHAKGRSKNRSGGV
jgi:hypothetical protein